MVTLEKVVFLKNDKFDGSSMSFYENGQIKSKTTWNEGTIEGLSLKYTEDGKLESLNNIKNGKEVGYQVSIDTNTGILIMNFNNSFEEKHGWSVGLNETNDTKTGICFINGLGRTNKDGRVDIDTLISHDDDGKKCNGLTTLQFIDEFKENYGNYLTN